jgi:hypothetical protein
MPADDEMRAEYDFSGGVRGTYAREIKEHGYTIRTYRADGTFTERMVLGEKMVVLDPDVWEYFPNSEAVNKALRAIISVIPGVAVKQS